MPMMPALPSPQQQYESVLDDVLKEVHALIRPAQGQYLIDDSKVHSLLQHLRDNYGPEAKS